MTQEQIQSYFNGVLGQLWPKWQTNDAQITTWTKALKYFDYNAVKRATEEHFLSQEGSYGRPKLNAVIEKARLYQPKKTPLKVEQGNYNPTVFVQCIEHDNPVKLYQFFAIHVARERRSDPDYIMRAAECTRQKVEACYGGQWIVIQGTTHSQMRDELTEHRRCSKSTVPSS